MRRMLTLLAVAFAVLNAGVAKASDLCQTAGACRAVGEVSIPGGGGKMESITIDDILPWVVENNAMLFPGDIVVISLPQDQEGQLPMSLVATGDAARTRTLAAGELRFTFAAMADGMTLTADSAHARTLHYMAVMVTPDGKPHKTSVCTLRTGIPVFESWPHGIVQLALANFIPVKDGETFCR